MLSASISLLFAAAGMLAVAVIVKSLREAQSAWERLMREGEVLRAGIALQAAAAAEAGRRRRLAAPAHRAFATRRPGYLPPLPLRACVAA